MLLKQKTCRKSNNKEIVGKAKLQCGARRKEAGGETVILATDKDKIAGGMILAIVLFLFLRWFKNKLRKIKVMIWL